MADKAPHTDQRLAEQAVKAEASVAASGPSPQFTFLLQLISVLAAAGGLVLSLTPLAIPEWVLIGLALLKAGPDVMEKFAAIGPAFEHFIEQLIHTNDPHAAALAVRQWIANNGDAVIRLYPDNAVA